MTRRHLTARQKTQIFLDHDGVCPWCGEKIDGAREAWDIDHHPALALVDFDESRTTLQPMHTRCHRGAGGKTAQDRDALAKSDSVRARHLGAKNDRRAIVPGSRASPWKRKADGTTVRRTDPQNDKPRMR